MFFVFVRVSSVWIKGKFFDSTLGRRRKRGGVTCTRLFNSFLWTNILSSCLGAFHLPWIIHLVGWCTLGEFHSYVVLCFLALIESCVLRPLVGIQMIRMIMKEDREVLKKENKPLFLPPLGRHSWDHFRPSRALLLVLHSGPSPWGRLFKQCSQHHFESQKRERERVIPFFGRPLVPVPDCRSSLWALSGFTIDANFEV